MRTLFLDQSGKLGGAELCLLDIAKGYRNDCLVGLFADGSFREQLEQHQIPVQVLTTEAIRARKDSNLLQGLSSLKQLVPLIARVTRLSYSYDLIYANTQKALVVGAIASCLSRRPLVYHLHDIVSPEHFSSINRHLIITLANRFASLVIANSEASQKAFTAAGGRMELTEVIYNGFTPESYSNHQSEALQLRQILQLDRQFIVGHFSRLSPWKGQHVLIEALMHCSEDVTAVFVGDALFGEQDYIVQLRHQVVKLGLEKRVHFLGFRSDIPQLMTACDLIAHTSTAAEPFGRVIVEGMLCQKPVVAAAAGGAVELIEPEQTGWLCPPNDPQKLAEIIMTCRNQPEQAAAIAQKARVEASQRFNLTTINQQIAQLLASTIGHCSLS
jgi:glycosyltransferase involved in cell wall biosynthesis